jgi:hypothetical protein
MGRDWSSAGRHRLTATSVRGSAISAPATKHDPGKGAPASGLRVACLASADPCLMILPGKRTGACRGAPEKGTRYACGMPPTAAAITGTVEAWPIRPVAIAGQPNTRPVAEAVVEALHEGRVVAATTTDEAGRYRLTVQPGTYLLRVTATGLLSKESSRTVTVSPGETLTAGFTLDTGIRCRWGHQPATCPLGVRCQWVRQEAGQRH